MSLKNGSGKNGRSEYWVTMVVEMPNAQLSAKDMYNVLDKARIGADSAVPEIVSRIIVVSNADRLEGYSPDVPDLTEQVKAQLFGTVPTSKTVQ